MNIIQPGFVPVPNFLRLSDKQLKYLDILVYASLRSFNNTHTDLCKPKHETIAARVGLSERFVVDSIKRLEDAKYITVVRSNVKRTSNHYYFPQLERYDEIPIGLLTDSDLSTNEKAILIGLRQFFVHGTVTCIDKPSQIAERLGLTCDTLKSQMKALIKKQYIVQEDKKSKDGQKLYRKYKLSEKVKWLYMPCLMPVVKKFNLLPSFYVESGRFFIMT